jgi:SAM-dependent methyltransferase
MHLTYTTLAKYYDLIYSQKDYQAEVDFILEVARKHKLKQHALLDVGCGTGSHLNLLSRHFPVLYGIDLNPEILDVAKKKLQKNVPTAKFLCAGMADFKLDSKFNLITCLYSVFNYNLDTKSATRTLKNFRKHLEPGGIAIIALYNERSTEKKTSIHMGQSDDGNTKVAKFNYYKYVPEIKCSKSDHVVFVKDHGKLDFDIEKADTFRIFDFDEISEMVGASGFKGYHLYDGFMFEEAREGSNYPVLVVEG